MSDLSHARSDELLALARLPMSDLLAQLSTRPEGLSAAEAASALQRFGTNTLALSRRTHPAWQLLRMLVSPLSLLLMALATASWLTGEARGAVVIVAMVVLSTLLSFVQERRSSQAAEKLKALVSTRIRVQRDGRDEDLDVALVVPGDVVHLAVGDIIPADLRLLDGKDLFVNEASLSGESLPADKHPAVPDASADSAFDLKNLCFMGSHVVSGTAHGVVLRTGAATFFGHIADETTRQRKKTAFDLGLERFTGLMIRFMAVMVPAVFIINGMVKGDWFEAALFAIAVAVGLTPEMLPMLATINLAKGALAMSRRKVIVKRLTAVQNMGAMDVLCTDKTGTLTQDSVILERHVDVTGQTDPLVLEYAYLNSHYQSGLRNLLDVAVLQHVEVHERLHDADTYTRVDEIPFDFERRRMSVVLERVPAAKHAADDSERSHILICKGAVEEVIACCRVARVSGAEVPLDDARRQQIDSVVAQLNNDGFRVIAVAIREEPAAPHEYSVADETGLTLLGYVAFLDPPKESAGPAIAALRESGVTVKILTGDNERVTRKICRDVGLPVERIVLGPETDALDDPALAKLAGEVAVFAKMTPDQKSRVIRALQSLGHVVGYMGDGINDGPSLKAADLSISVDSAVDIAKESADIILLEKSLLVLQQGVLEGRRVFANLMKYIRMSASSNFGNMFSMLGASALLPFLPMAPVQVLLNNLLYDFSQTAVPTDTVDDEYLRQPRAWDIGGIARTMVFIGPISSLFDYATFGLMWWVLGATAPADAALFQTGWFVESLLSQTLIVHVLRTARLPFVESAPSPALLATTLGICAIGVLLPYTPLGASFNLVPLPANYWLAMAVLLPAYFALTQWVKGRLVRRFGVS
ncbi:MAG: magnesium-translocating P-type ATPase [Betaproteobacteria bacterium]|nr:magnesium-translocating P-type ATPase [Betaproteobacteria bacterium]